MAGFPLNHIQKLVTFSPPLALFHRFQVVSVVKTYNYMQIESFSCSLLALQSQDGEVANWPFRTARRA
jgi:hypothetical protein